MAQCHGNDAQMTFGEYRQHYVDNILPMKKLATQLGFKSRLKYFDCLNDDEIDNLDPMKVQRIFTELATRPAKPLKPQTLKTVYVPFRVIMRQAEADNYVTKIPKPRLPKQKREQQSWFTLQQMWMLFDISFGIKAIFYKCLCETGMRIGECMDLTWNKIDFHARTMNINSSQFLGKSQEPKTQAAYRVICMSNELTHLFCDMKPENAEPTDFVWRNPKTQKNYSPTYFALDLHRLKRIIGVKETKGGFHALRRGNATILHDTLDIPEKVISFRLGHEAQGLTLGLYVQKFEGMDKEASIRLGLALYKKEDRNGKSLA